MAWYFEGDGTDISLRIKETGQLSINGFGTQDCEPQFGDFGILRTVSGLPGVWSIHCSDAEEVDYDGGAWG